MKLVSLLTIAVMLMSTGCSKKQPLENITVLLDWTPNTNHTGLYVAEALGYFAEEGLNVTIMQPSEGTASSLVASGKAQFGFSYQEEVTYALTADAPLPIKAIATVLQHNTSGFASPTEKKIMEPRDFEGKRYGGWGSPMEEMMLRDLMKRTGGSYDKITMVNIGASDYFTAIRKDIDFGWIFYGWDGIQAEVRNIKLNFTFLKDIDPVYDYYTPVIITNNDTITSNPALIKRFLRALSKGYAYAAAEPDKAAELLIKAVPEFSSNKEFIIASQRYLSVKYKDDAVKWGLMKKETWERFGAWMFTNKLVSRPFVPENAFTNEYLP